MLNLRTKKSNAQRFWRSFKEWETRIRSTKAPVDRMQFEINELLNTCFSGVQALITIDLDGNYELTFTVNGMPSNFSKVFDLIDYAPEIECWKWQAFRPKDPHLKSVTFDGQTLKLSDAFFEYSKDRAKLGIRVYVRGYIPDSGQEALCYRLIDRFIGELEVYQKIKWIDLHPLDEEKVLIYFPLSFLPTIMAGYDLEINN